MKPDGVWAHAWGNGGRYLMVAMITFSLAVGALITVAVTTVLRTDPTPYAPLSYPPKDQHVLTPVIKNGEGVEVEGTRCSSAKKPIGVQGTFSWDSYTPSGFRFLLPIAEATRQPGCQRTRFVNAMPAEIVAINTTLFAKGERQVQWRLNGYSAAFNPSDGKLGPPASWRSEIFTVIPG